MRLGRQQIIQPPPDMFNLTGPIECLLTIKAHPMICHGVVQHLWTESTLFQSTDCAQSNPGNRPLQLLDGVDATDRQDLGDVVGPTCQLIAGVDDAVGLLQQVDGRAGRKKIAGNAARAYTRMVMSCRSPMASRNDRAWYV